MPAELPRPTVHDMSAYEREKRWLIHGLAGRVLEIGAGTGQNLALLGRDVEWIGLEPHRRSRRRLVQSGAGAVLDATAEDIPLADRSVDAVLGTKVLCCAPDQDRALREVVRVLRPGGRFVFFDHVAAPRGTAMRWAQSLTAPLTRIFDRGCDPARETWRALERAPFRELRLEWYARGRQPFVGGYGVA